MVGVVMVMAFRDIASVLVLLVFVLVVLVALAAYAMRRNTGSAAAEDCETKPPPNTFAVAECDDGAAPGTPAAPATATKP